MFSGHCWKMHRVVLENNFPNGVPLWARIFSPVVWILYSLLAYPARWFRKIKTLIYGPYPERRHLIPLNHEAIVERGGDSHGYYILLKCPQCGALVLHDGECESFCPDISNLGNQVALSSDGCPCIRCGFVFKDDMIYGWFNDRSFAKRFTPSRREIEVADAMWILANK